MLRMLILSLLGLACGLVLAAPFTLATFTPTVARFDNTLYIPARPLAEMIGATITEDTKTGATTLKLGEKSVTFTPGKPGEKAKPFTLFNGGLAVPLQACVDALGIELVDARNTVTLKLPGDRLSIALTVEDNQGDSAFSCYDDADMLFMMKPDGSDLRRLSYRNADGIGIGMVSFAPDGSFLLTYNNYCQVLMRPTTSREERVVGVIESADFDTTLPVSADGNFYYIRQDNLVSRVQIAGGNKQPLCFAKEYALSPNGKYLAAVQRPGIEPGKVILVTQEDNNQRELGMGSVPVFTPDGNKLAFHQAGQDKDGKYIDVLTLYTIQPAENRKIYPQAGMGSIPMAFSTDGKELIVNTGAKNGLCVLDLLTGKPRALAPWQDDMTYIAARFTTDNKAVIALQAYGDLFRVKADGTGLARLTKGFSIDAFTLTPGGEYVVFHGTPKTKP
ncbi:MAG: hypothetical protein ACYDCO_07175 [Armatimonadota bacterium]